MPNDLTRKLADALREMAAMYTHAWDRTDGSLMMMPGSVERFDTACEKASAALADFDALPCGAQGDGPTTKQPRFSPYRSVIHWLESLPKISTGAPYWSNGHFGGDVANAVEVLKQANAAAPAAQPAEAVWPVSENELTNFLRDDCGAYLTWAQAADHAHLLMRWYHVTRQPPSEHPAQEVEKPRGWVCPSCKADRSRVACPRGHSAALTGQCPMTGTAQGSGS